MTAEEMTLFAVDRIHKIPISRTKKMVYGGALVLVPGLVGSVYFSLLYGLPDYIIQQCILTPNTDPNKSTFLNTLWTLVHYYGVQFYRQGLMPFGGVLIASAVYVVYLSLKGKIADPLKRQLKAAYLVLFVFAVFGLHEYFLSGVLYRVYWVDAMEMMACFLIILTAMIYLPKPVQILFCTFVLWTALSAHCWRNNYFKIVKNYIPLERAQVYTTNSRSWVTTVTLVTRFLEGHLAPRETFLALPGEQLYYFLTGRDSPTRQTELGVKLTEEQELDIIKSLETKGVRYIVISNRFRSPERGLGRFGVDYGWILGEYINEHFEVNYMFGEWDKDPQWVENHGVVIAERVPD